ncbi:MurR/RpiR family transcriptional regulator [Lysinibacillus parviboronicapiens]|jgi:DNA-binding MurR/RpiR family transcriptional regulator|uniref:DNA-binding MurR/RpiR family transcriptional regulator n=1 Tax=Lysinibacillus parviboronicapiens TaxID=436516 RepID=A0ABV2PJL8_9BACI|nr:MurR/RpiR family transcriptional regulator [Lysinibacillus parviboronicapiens]
MEKINAGLIMLAEMEERLPPSERKVASYILEHPTKAIKMTAVELGEASKTSGAAVIRLCKSLNVSGIQELKLRIAGDLQREMVDDRDIEPNEPLQTIVEKVTTQSSQILRETADLIDDKELLRAVTSLAQAKRIFFFGVGASGIAAMDADQKFLRINKNSTALMDLHLGATAVVNAEEGDVVVGISFSGETHEVAKILEIASETPATTISLTRYGNSLVSSLADICLYTSPNVEATFRSGATSSRLAQLHVIDILFMAVATSSYEQTINYLDTTRAAIEGLHKKVVKRKN